MRTTTLASLLRAAWLLDDHTASSFVSPSSPDEHISIFEPHQLTESPIAPQS